MAPPMATLSSAAPSIPTAAAIAKAMNAVVALDISSRTSARAS